MVKDLLYISKIDNITSTYVKTECDLNAILRACAQQQSAIAEARQVNFVLDLSDAPVYYECAEELMTRAIDNLISNAIRYAKSKITLSCQAATNSVSIRVSDDGAGIDPQSMSHIYERFYKGSDGNYGIGLSLVKSIVEQHNGRVSAVNSESGGAVFTITLPYAARRPKIEQGRQKSK
jgi:signal transduction histidine kinase